MASSTFDVNVSVSPTWSYEWNIIIVNSKQEFDDTVEHAWVATVHEITSKSMKDDGVCVEDGGEGGAVGGPPIFGPAAPDCVKDLTVQVSNGNANKRLKMDNVGQILSLRFDVQLVDTPPNTKFLTQILFDLYMVDVVKRTMSFSQGPDVLVTYNKYLVQFGGVVDTDMIYGGTSIDSYTATTPSPSVGVGDGSDGGTSTKASSSSSSSSSSDPFSSLSSGMIVVVVIVPIAVVLMLGVVGRYINMRVKRRNEGRTTNAMEE